MFNLIGSVLLTIAAGLAVGIWCAIITLIVPGPVRVARNTVLIAPVTAVLIGLLAIAIAVGLNGLSILIVTIPLIALADLIVLGLGAVGVAVIAEPIGHLILRRRGIYAAPIAAAAIGGFTLTILLLVLNRLPLGLSIIGMIATAILSAAGIGALILTRMGRRVYPPYTVV